uniref:Putative theromacin-like protein n=1 Tax=Haementeria vizottoi TaxID=1628691 RepID=A0A0N7Z9P3_9ANNE
MIGADAPRRRQAPRGILWLPCDQYCKECFDADSGTCVDSPSTNCPGVLENNKQCKCNNAKKAKDKWNPKCWA